MVVMVVVLILKFRQLLKIYKKNMLKEIKMKVKIERGMTYNTGNFSNIQPKISLTFDIDENKNLSEQYMTASEIAEELFTLETVSLLYNQEDLRTKRTEEYCRETFENLADHIENINNLQKQLKR
jgi:hypothetical protein